ncbi:MAG: hypothetical protein ACAI38_10535 [Myxococcota bacterium]|nr:hypothetical protein [Myxococcota bacterium]
MIRRAFLLSAIAATCACGGDDVEVQLVMPQASDLTCGSTVPAGLAATLFISGNLAPCNLTVDSAGRASGTCGDIPTGITRFLVLRFAVPGDGRALPVRYAITQADLTPQRLRDSEGTVSVTFSDDDITGMYVDTDDDVADLRDLLNGPKGPLASALCFARSLIATDAGTTEVAADCRDQTTIAEILDLDADSCTNLRELCDGTSPEDDGSASCVN